jgi:predicted MPP superfamily phosphohydrolase
MGFFVIVFLFYTLVNIYVFWRGWQTLPAVGEVRFGYVFVFFFLYVGFVFAMLARHTMLLPAQKVFYGMGTVWMGVVFYLVPWFLITDGIGWFCRRAPRSARWDRRRHRRLFRPERRKVSPRMRKWQVGVGYVLVLSVLAVGYGRFRHPVVVERCIELVGEGEEFRSIKMVVVSDLHLGVAIDRRMLRGFVRQINGLEPEVVLVAGDVVDNNLLPLNKEQMEEEFNGLAAPLGVFMCLGNHEYLSGIAESRDFLGRTQMDLLVDRAVCVDSCFWIVGRDDLHGNPGRAALAGLVGQTDGVRPVVVLDHEPWDLGEAVACGVDVQFSGHTHHGQIWPLNWVVERLFPLGYGYRRVGDTHFYVSSGLGLWGPPFRIGTRSEIVLVELRVPVG